MTFSLAFDCSSWLMSVAYRVSPEAPPAAIVRYSRDDLSYELITVLQNLKLQGSGEVIIPLGPGSFTGLKVNLAIALGIKTARKDLVACYGVSLIDLAKALGKNVFVKITSDDYLLADPFSHSHKFLKSHDVEKVVCQSDPNEIIGIYCDLDFAVSGRPLRTRKSIAELLLDLKACWKEIDREEVTLNYGLDVKFRKIKSE
ncbi:MAG: hypothetical protein NZT61_02700 [Deltaproteobacteria bacterium]|nr:hypothetical protein [Deltaproteobacteria bacterium]